MSQFQVDGGAVSQLIRVSENVLNFCLMQFLPKREKGSDSRNAARRVLTLGMAFVAVGTLLTFAFQQKSTLLSSPPNKSSPKADKLSSIHLLAQSKSAIAAFRRQGAPQQALAAARTAVANVAAEDDVVQRQIDDVLHKAAAVAHQPVPLLLKKQGSKGLKLMERAKKGKKADPVLSISKATREAMQAGEEAGRKADEAAKARAQKEAAETYMQLRKAMYIAERAAEVQERREGAQHQGLSISQDNDKLLRDLDAVYAHDPSRPHHPPLAHAPAPHPSPASRSPPPPASKAAPTVAHKRAAAPAAASAGSAAAAHGAGMTGTGEGAVKAGVRAARVGNKERVRGSGEGGMLAGAPERAAPEAALVGLQHPPATVAPVNAPAVAALAAVTAPGAFRPPPAAAAAQMPAAAGMKPPPKTLAVKALAAYGASDISEASPSGVPAAALGGRREVRPGGAGAGGEKAEGRSGLGGLASVLSRWLGSL